MAQQLPNDFPIDPVTTSGTALADVLNRQNQAFNTNNAGATPPVETFPGMQWLDTSVSPNVLRIRNAANTGWATIPLSNDPTGNLGQTIAINGQPSATIVINKAGSGSQNAIFGRSNTVNRWAMVLGDGAAESGANTGSNFSLLRYDDAGNYSGTVMSAERSTGIAHFPQGASGITAAQVGLGGVENWRQVRAFQNGTIFIGWEGSNLNLQVDSTYFAATWPINVTGRSETAGLASLATTAAGQDRVGTWGFANGDFAMPYMRLDQSASVRTLIFQQSNDNTVQGFGLTGINPAVGASLVVYGTSGAWSVPVQPSDEGGKVRIAPTKVAASQILRDMSFIEFAGRERPDELIELGFSAQKLRAQNKNFASERIEADDNGGYMVPATPNQFFILAYVAKALQETIERVDALEGRT